MVQHCAISVVTDRDLAMLDSMKYSRREHPVLLLAHSSHEDTDSLSDACIDFAYCAQHGGQSLHPGMAT